MRTTNLNRLYHWLPVIGIVLMTQAFGPVACSFGQGPELFPSPLSGLTPDPVVPNVGKTIPSSTFGPPVLSLKTVTNDELSNHVFAAPVVAGKVGDAHLAGPDATIRRGTKVTAKEAAPVKSREYLQAQAYQDVSGSWEWEQTSPPPSTQPVATMTEPSCVVTKSPAQPTPLAAPACLEAALDGIDLSKRTAGRGCEVSCCTANASTCCAIGGSARGVSREATGCGSCRSSRGRKMECTSARCLNSKCGGLCGCDCGRSPFWARIEALLWYMEGYATPELVSRSPGGTPQNMAGVLGNDSTRLLFGNNDIGDDLRVGGRLETGFWFDPCRKFGIQADFFALGGGGDTVVFHGNGVDAFARPFFNTDPNINAQDSQIFAMPGLAEGSVRFNTSSNVISASPALRWNLSCCQDPCGTRSRRVDFLLGYRFFRVDEEFAAQEILIPTDGIYVAGTRLELNDRITSENEFHGLELGLNHMHQRGKWMLDIATLFAVGEVQRSVTLDGSTRVTVPGFQDTTLPGGFYLGPNDVGRYQDRDYAVIPQVRTSLSFCMGCNWRLGVGYNFMYLSSMFRPDSYLNTSFDGSRLARAPVIGVVGNSPATPKRDLFLHGANVNLTYNF